ncbi:tetratricopeptide repeat protein [Shimia marina]|uniref:Cellulose synthase subunit BcsC n=1 Tax=Shimia marina TaxID=321267 RepID=A0A0P1EQQ0_9RHOB|nr:tetratricopeptide repeat protein [Shimia marina]CUH52499.1 cellulose synthase subunit BcsC [Shimia marina]SFE13464.1 Tfp pilus assembly protein PilF [Shimia marina]
MRLLFPLLMAALAGATAVDAKPLVSSSEETLESVCLSYADQPERLIEICGAALEASGATEAQRLRMQDSLAWAHQNLGNHEEARRLFEAMYAAAPESDLALNGLGWSDFMRDDYAQAAVWFEKAMAVNPEAQALAGLGSSLYRAGQAPIDQAVGYLDAAMAISPDYLWALREKGWLFMEEGQLDLAQGVFEEVLGLSPDDENAAYGISYVLSDKGEWQAALGFVNRALQADPSYLSALSRRSLILLNLGRPAQAMRDGETIVALLPDNSDGYVRVARAQAQMGRTGDAFATLETAKDKLGYEAYLNYWRASLLFDDGQNQAALQAITEVFENGEADYFDHELRSQILLTEEQYVEARQAVNHSISVFPDEEWLIYYDALTLIGEKDFQAAEQRFDQAVDAGLPQEELGFFLKQLVGAAQFVQAIQMRVRYSENDG